MTATATATATAIEKFATTVKENAAKKVGNSDELRALIVKCKTALPPMTEESRIKEYLQARSNTLEILTKDYFVSRITSKYPLIDKTLFKKQRYLTFNKENQVIDDSTQQPDEVAKGNNVCVIPLFAKVTPGRRRTNVGKFVRRQRDSWNSSRRITTDITAELPTPPNAIIAEGRKAMGFIHQIIGEVYSDDVLSDLLPDHIEIPNLGVFWIPTIDSLSIKVTEEVVMPRRRDPALTLEYSGMTFLVATYDIIEEKPIEHFLREYTTGNAEHIFKNKKK